MMSTKSKYKEHKYTVSYKIVPPNVCPYLYQILTDFNITGTFGGHFAIT